MCDDKGRFMKKRAAIMLTALAVAVLLAIPLCGCQSAGTDTPDATEAASEADESAFDGIDRFEVKFVLDPTKVLGEDLLVQDAYRQEWNLGEHESSRVRVAFLETDERDFESFGWLNRVRKKDTQDYATLCYKKRYKLEGDDLASTKAEARSDGFDLEALASDDDVVVKLEWNTSAQTLSIDYQAKLEGIDFPDEDSARQLAAAHMPAIEQNLGNGTDGKALMERTRYAGPVDYKEYRGSFGEDADCSFKVEIWTLKEGARPNDCIAELSFEVGSYEEAEEYRAYWLSVLEPADVLSSEDGMKTPMVLDAYLGD